MRLLTARVRDYRLHRDLEVAFDRRFTVISGPNQSGKSTLVEALHRALFLPVKTGGEVLKAMQPSPFRGDPEVEVVFEAAAEHWTLRKRFAAGRGSVALLDGRGRGLQGDAAEERLAALVGTGAVARNRAAAEQLRERWGHLWVWQGSASGNPLALGAAAYDHDRLVERLQAAADQGVTSALDQRVLEDIQRRWETVFTAGGANRAPQVRKGSDLQRAQAAEGQAAAELAAIEASLADQGEAEQAHQRAVAQLQQLALVLPQRRAERQALAQRLARSRELEAEIGARQPLLEALQPQLAALERDRIQLNQEQAATAALERAQAPAQGQLAALRERLPALEEGRGQAQLELAALRQASERAGEAVRRIEARLQRGRLFQEISELQQRQGALALLQGRLRALDADLAALPAVDAEAVAQLRRLEAALRAAEVRAEALAASIAVVRADQAVRLDGEALEAGSSVLLSRPMLLEVGDTVTVRLTPGGGDGPVAAGEAVVRARQALEVALRPWGSATVEELAAAERRRGDQLAERQGLERQIAAAGDPSRLAERLANRNAALAALPPRSGTAAAAAAGAPGSDPPPGHPEAAADRSTTTSASPAATNSTPTTASTPTAELAMTPAGEPSRPPAGALPDPEQLRDGIARLEIALGQARQAQDQASQAQGVGEARLQQLAEELEAHRLGIARAEHDLRERDNQLLAGGTRIAQLLQRHGSAEALDEACRQGQRQRDGLQSALDALRAELAALDPAAIRAEDQRLEQAIASLEAEERQATEARIRAEGQLHADGQRDLQADLEQKLSDLESRRQERQRLEREAAMLTLLRGLLEEEQNAMGSEYAAPLAARIGRYLAAVFPEPPRASLRYDARGGFQGLEWRRGEEAAFDFAVLSTGAREQFAAALRLAMAEVLAEAYDGCLPLVFDDAFAHSDPERQRGVHRMLAEAADQGLQVILLSCDTERSPAIAAAHQIRLGEARGAGDSPTEPACVAPRHGGGDAGESSEAS
jgi:energy-coupling factor transporter ATP-binding protein EcfA2